MPYTPLGHTADTGIEVTADSLALLIEEAAAGMFALMASADPSPGATPLDTAVEAATTDDLLVDSLSELLYLAETEDLHLCYFEVEQTDRSSVQIHTTGVPTRGVEPTGPSIKAVTYHQLEVSETDTGWRATIYFDV